MGFGERLDPFTSLIRNVLSRVCNLETMPLSSLDRASFMPLRSMLCSTTVVVSCNPSHLLLQVFKSRIAS